MTASLPARGKVSLVVGCETHRMESKTFVTGIERVLLETHKGLWLLAPGDNLTLRRVHTSQHPASQAFLEHEQLASDPVLRSKLTPLQEVEALLILDMSSGIAWREIIKEKQRRSLPVIFMVHDVLPLSNPEWFAGGEEGRRAFWVYLQQGLRVADVVLVASETVRDSILALGWSVPGRIVVIPLGSLHAAREPRVAASRRFSLLSVTTLEPRKGHARLLDAFDLLRASDVDVELVLVGRPGWDSDELFARIRQHKDFGGRLKWFASASDEQVVSYASAANIAVIPADGEGFGMFLEEALTLGLKVVASDIPVFRERTQKNVHFSALNPQALADTILAAGEAPWEPFARGEIRSMKDFSAGVYDHVLQELQPKLTRHNEGPNP